MTELEEKIMDAYEEQGCNVVGMRTYFDEVEIGDMTREELELFCSFLSHELMQKNPIIEVSIKIKSEKDNA